MSTVFEQKLHEKGDLVWAVAASTTEPYLYTRFRCRVAKRRINLDTITYFLQIEEILENKEWIQRHCHRQEFRMWHCSAGRGQLKALDCFDLLLESHTFEQKFMKRFADWALVVSSVHVAETAEHLDAICEQTVDIMHDHLTHSLQVLSLRRKTLSAMTE